MITHKGTQAIHTERLILRKFTVDDVKSMFENWANDKRVTEFLTWEPHGSLKVTQEIVTNWVKEYESESNYNWAIELNGKIIGSIGVVSLSEKDEAAELGYCSAFECWGQGLMTEAVRAVIGFLFFQVNVNRIVIEHAVKNPASGRVAQKCGFTHEGIMREAYKSPQGEFWDISKYAVLKKDWLKAQTQ